MATKDVVGERAQGRGTSPLRPHFAAFKGARSSVSRRAERLQNGLSSSLIGKGRSFLTFTQNLS